jgi:hypothetical protein
MAFHRPDSPGAGMPLLVAMHGGTYTSAYFGIAGGPAMLGPEGSISPEARKAALASYAPVPFVELVEPPACRPSA